MPFLRACIASQTPIKAILIFSWLHICYIEAAAQTLARLRPRSSSFTNFNITDHLLKLPKQTAEIYIPSLGTYVPSLGMYVPSLGTNIPSFGTKISANQRNNCIPQPKVLITCGRRTPRRRLKSVSHDVVRTYHSVGCTYHDVVRTFHSGVHRFHWEDGRKR